jgi:serine/threonine-protein kinase
MTTQASMPTQTDELVGRVINERFRIISVIARGGMGRVYRAEQLPLGRLVAIKTLDPRHQGGDTDPHFQQRFFLEASVASKLQHPNTVTVFDYGRTADGIYFIAMELVEGRSLLNLVRQEAPLPAHRVTHIAMQIARSLREAHRVDVIHRDLKPGNILLARHGDEEDFVKVLDFGLVKHVESEAEEELTKAGLFMGSPKYMSPEQIRGERVDARADIYSLGVVMYEMLSGKVPFDRDNTVKVLMGHMHEVVPPLQVDGCPEGLSQLVMRCLGKTPDERPASMDEVISLLKLASGLSLTTSGAFSLSQEVRLSMSPSAGVQVGTPSHGLSYGTQSSARPLSGESAGFSSVAGVMPQTTQASVRPSALASWLPKFAVIGALAIAGGFLALRFSERGEAASVRSAPAPSAAVGTVGVAPLEAPSQAQGTTETERSQASSGAAEVAPEHVLVRLTSTPSGASVSADGKDYGQTPADIEWWGEAAAQGRQITFVFEKGGYEKVTVVRSIHGDSLNVEATLPAVRAVRRRHAAPEESSNPATTTRGPVVVPDNFKDDPY